ncbi:TlpA family protein disulfide reductase [Parafilimonas sp.]|uniref:TlpA family protein disulfide reductase n=1 Tax=Parafilimonas sp. TaxID=1969739 RepID=UPI0039E5ACE4
MYKVNRVVLISIVAILLSTSYGNTQSILPGQQCPDIELKNIVNYSKSSARISDFRGKLLILDFWATWCSPCVSEFPVMDSLQKTFGNQLQIMPIAYQSRQVVSNFFNNMRNVIHILPSSVTEDTVLTKLFPHTAIPHYVWIDKTGKVIAITGYEEVTSENIQKILNGNMSQLSLKTDDKLNIDFNNQVFEIVNPVNSNGGMVYHPINEKDILCHEVITRYIKGFISQAHQDSIRFTATNMTIENLYKWALGHGYYQFSSDNRIRWEINDSSLYHLNHQVLDNLPNEPERLEWMKENAFCYELTIPRSSGDPNEKYNIMLSDLNRYFGSLYGIEAHLEKRNVKCLVLTRINTEDKLATEGGSPFLNDNKYYLELKNQPLIWLMIRLATYYMQLSPMPLLDETEYKGNIDLKLNCRLSDISAVNNELEKYGLEFKEAMRMIDIIVISKKKSTS